MSWRRQATHRLVAAAEVYELTGFGAKEVLFQPDTQRLVRIDEDGTRHDFVRIPLELLNSEPVSRVDDRG